MKGRKNYVHKEFDAEHDITRYWLSGMSRDRFCVTMYGDGDVEVHGDPLHNRLLARFFEGFVQHLADKS